MPTISSDELKKSSEFNNIIFELLDIIDNIATRIDDNEYLKICNNLKKLKDNNDITDNKMAQLRFREYITTITERVNNNSVILRHRQREQMKVRTATEMKTDAQKLKDGWVRCKKCDRLVVKEYFNKHQYSDVCVRIAETKKLSKKLNKKNTARYNDAITKIRGVILNYEGFKLKMIKSKF